jgi:hypothetical protein
MKTLLKKNLIVILASILLYGQSVNAQTTYTVTATTEDGPGSIIEAVLMANANPGPDIIEFTPGLQINASTQVISPFMLEITESLIIDGKGGALNGFQHWITNSGIINSTSTCPGSDQSVSTILAEMPGLLNIGINNQDNTGIEVTIKNLEVKQFNELARIRENASLIVDNVKAKEIFSAYECKTTPMFFADEGASLTLRNSEFTESETWGEDAISGLNAGDLIIENCLFYDLNKREHFTINWNGQTGSNIHIVSSRFVLAGGINISGNVAECNFVNSTWVNGSDLTPAFGDRIINNSTGIMNINASSILWNTNQCDFQCQNNGITSLIESKIGDINLIQSAIGYNFSSTSSNLINTLGGTGSGFSASDNTWVEPTSNQDIASLKTITGQPNLITNTPAFNSPVLSTVSDLELLQPNISGVLIDVIDTPLINPITNTEITVDVIGNERLDANGFRDIGAIQLSLAPFLTLADTGQSSADLSWNEPLHHDNFPIVKYEVSYSEKGSSNATTVVVNSSNLTETISGLSFGQTYEFKVRAVYDDNGTEIIGPFSNTVDAAFFSSFGTLNLTATPGNAEVNVSWNLPGLGGRSFERYLLLYRIEGTTQIIGVAGSITDPNQTNYLATNLTNDTTYEFILSVKASGEWSSEVFATATPSASLGINEFLKNKILYYPNPVNDYLNILTEESFHVKLFSVNGTLILDLINEKKLDISNLKTGLYIIQLEINDKLYFGKILKD